MASIKDKFDSDANKEFKGEKIITRVSGKDKSTHRMTIVGYNDDIMVDINKNEIIIHSVKIYNKTNDSLHAMIESTYKFIGILKV